MDNKKLNFQNNNNLINWIQKNKRKLFLILTVVISTVIIAIIAVSSIGLKVELRDNLHAEQNKNITIYDFIVNVENGTIESPNEQIDTSEKGKQDINVELSWYFGLIKYTFTIEVVDSMPPDISGPDELKIHPDNINKICKFFNISDNSKEDVNVEISGDYNSNLGTYPIKIKAIDSSNNVSEKDVSLTITDDINNFSFLTNNEFVANVIDGVTYINSILIVNKSYSLPSSYGSELTDETINNFNVMKNDAYCNGLNLYIASGYRSYWTQSNLYSSYCSYDSQSKVDTYSARPGHSEHQSGLAFDLNSIDDSFAYTQEGQWVYKNCWKYGFILRYPSGKESITGYKYEPWHLRYVGKELAEKLFDNGNWITLEEYFGIDSMYR